MSNKFIAKKKIRVKAKIIFFLFMLIIGLLISYKKMEKSKIKLKDQELKELIVNNTFINKNYFFTKIFNKTLEITNPIKLLNNNYKQYLKYETLPTQEEQASKEEQLPLIYIYNTHQKEEYKTSEYLEFTINPTVMINDYILEDIFNKNNYKTIVEESSISDILNANNWSYSSSYKASRILLEEGFKKNPSLKYFIDVHRDSLEKNKTTITIDDKSYAKVLFIVGLENPNYQENLNFTEKINNKLNEYYPNLSKGIYKKSGPGVDGVYNQDFSKYTILIEIGGYQNTTVEVLNTTLAFSKCFLEVINEENI